MAIYLNRFDTLGTDNTNRIQQHECNKARLNVAKTPKHRNATKTSIHIFTPLEASKFQRVLK